MNFQIKTLFIGLKDSLVGAVKQIKLPGKHPKINANKITKAGYIFLVTAAVVMTFLYVNERKKNDSLGDRINSDVEEVILKVSRHILIPTNEKPVVATLDNVELLKAKEPLFYKDASKGDKVLIYRDQVIIYNPGKNIVIKVAPVLSGEASKQP